MAQPMAHEHEVVAEVERPGEAHDRDLDDHQPQAAGEQEARHLGLGPPAIAVEESGNAGEEDEDRRAEVGDPAGHE
jgi:hypothetical protein